METLDGMGHLGLVKGLDDDMHYAIRRLFFEDDVSKGINYFPPELHQNPTIDYVKREFVQEFKLPRTN